MCLLRLDGGPNDGLEIEALHPPCPNPREHRYTCVICGHSVDDCCANDSPEDSNLAWACAGGVDGQRVTRLCWRRRNARCDNRGHYTPPPRKAPLEKR